MGELRSFQGYVFWLRSWMVGWLSPDDVPVIAGGECSHDLDPEVTVWRLVSAAVHAPEDFAEVLADFADCTGCTSAVLGQLVYQLASFALAAEPADEEDDLPCWCTHPMPGEVSAMKLVLCSASHDSDAMGTALAQILGCPSCMVEALTAQTAAAVSLLDHQSIGWRPVLERSLLAKLDGGSDG